MIVTDKDQKFDKETDLCRAFIDAIPKEWTAYPETGGFDILLVRKSDGFQIAVEAKLKLNAKVICQAAEQQDSWYLTSPAPDCRAVLVPDYVSQDLSCVCKLLGLTVLKMRHPENTRFHGRSSRFYPNLPEKRSQYSEDGWQEFAPAERLDVPDWIPDVAAGNSSPVMLTFWKIGAIKLSIILENRGFLTRKDFKSLRVSMSRWTQGSWIIQNGKGHWIKGDYFPDFRKQHPTNYAQIEADFEKWRPLELEDA